MTVSELYMQVAHLGFEDSLESNERFLYAVERAIYQINGFRPHISHVDIVHYPLENLVAPHTPYSDDVVLVNKAGTVFEAHGAVAYSLEAKGVGEIYIYTVVRDQSNEEQETLIGNRSFDLAELTVIRGVLDNTDGKLNGKLIRIKISTNNLVFVRNVAMYGEKYSDNPEDVPAFTPYIRYDLSAIRSDFLAFDSPPIVESDDNSPLCDYYDVEGNELLLSRDISGVFKVAYKRKPAYPSYTKAPSNNNDPIDLDEEMCTLLPLLVASYVFLEDEPERSTYYKSLFNERVAEIQAHKRDYKVKKVINTNGW